MKVCIIGPSGKLGKYMVHHALDRGYEVVGVCREGSVGKLEQLCSSISDSDQNGEPKKRQDRRVPPRLSRCTQSLLS
jgi:putative NADH-flavin reductase